MAIYVVMEPPAGKKAEDVHFVRDSFTWLGFLFSPLWLAWNRLWIEAVLAFVVMAVLSALGERLGLEWAGSMLSLLVSLYVGFEGQALRIATLRRRGWREWGVVEAGDLADAEIRFAAEVDDHEPEPTPMPRIIPDASLARPPQTGMALGLTHTPGRP
ncbi:DUF2628 domain-containing protein [Mesorhizobium sp. M2A.F.Ca.ET.037.01.1.1]|uniref:DUF2628 domain-containing protein n=2 Tax=Mesorhizobium TaxID=68287 RepID=UPI000F75E8BB|nr:MULTISPECIES: DUF2628 domain-containing protein [unclassified Mesorhizobium]RUY09668.1 DUF2628 domain-containing protein [Mesorhizobium sp. M2A.F.Ca.ET.040.01.1.1]RVC66149.1 DUF2628 domain-containing protein [Mesorhizobium sp. M00.F.Ca.ET.038.03.1.1]RVC76712.1 DUF2628 domain-containing protein [Mesorhizobium sp. M2A.F.Ca.ET.046.02.1.1]AZO35327.1 DUF2628 domain-containing protein [Mesorhizobium sp. M2A.F.Ca.ET.046.03.2.1]RUX08995.1 DUF2628 domain-containing protein [Mesorhizobium sp. M2A.F.C